MVPEKILLAIPTYNEAENIEPMIQAVWAAVPNIHVVIIDDNSSDGTATIVKKLRETNTTKLHLIERPGKLGLGTAYVAAFKWGLARGYQGFIEMDADFSHNPNTLPTMIERLTKSDFVIGSRYIEGGGTENWSFFRKLISKSGSLYARTILGISIRDLTGGFNAWNRKVLEQIGIDSIKSEGYSFQIELKYRAVLAGFTWEELPILFSERRAGQSKMSGNIILEAMKRVWVLRRYTKQELLKSKQL